MKKNITAFLLVFISVISYAQNIGVNSTGSNPATSVMLEVDAAPGNNRDMITFGYVVLAGYSLDFSSPLFFLAETM